jgi:riboflavin-specific deaminase-like protein
MRLLLPEVRDDVDVEDLYAGVERPRLADRPWVALDMVTSVDGASSAAGRSAGLSSPTDKLVFHAMRNACDAILVGAGTVRAERYGPPRPDERQRARRVERGLTERPRLVVVSGRLDLDPDLRMFSDANEPPIVITRADADAEAFARLGAVAEVIPVGDDRVDLPSAMRALHALGVRTAVCEGGPILNAALLAADLVDEVCVTISPVLVGGPSTRIVAGAPEALDHDLRLAHLATEAGSLFLRYVRA